MTQAAAILEPVMIPVAKIRTDGGTQMRESLDPKHVCDLAELYGSGAPMDPVVVYYDGSEYWLADGFHRVAARKRLGDATIECEIRSGEKRDAVLFACGVNDHKLALRRSNQDKRRAVMTLLRDEEWGNPKKWSNERIAQQCKVERHYVAALRKELAQEKEPGSDYHVPPTGPVPTVKQSGADCKLPDRAPEMRTGVDGVQRSMPGTSKAPGAARKRVTETVVEYEPEEPAAAEEPIPEDEPIPFTVAEPLPIEPARQEPEPAPVSDSRPAIIRREWPELLGALRAQREADPDYSANRERDKQIRERLGTTRAALIIDFVLRGGELTFARLGLDYSSTADELKAAYRAESVRCHPDRGGDAAEMARLNEQYAVAREYFEGLAKL